MWLKLWSWLKGAGRWVLIGVAVATGWFLFLAERRRRQAAEAARDGLAGQLAARAALEQAVQVVRRDAAVKVEAAHALEAKAEEAAKVEVKAVDAAASQPGGLAELGNQEFGHSAGSTKPVP